MKILFCVNSLGALGGIQRVTIVKANALAEIQGNEVAVCYTDKGDYPNTIHPLSPKVKIFDLGTPYWKFTSLKKVLLSFLPAVLATRRALKNIIQSYKPDVVVTTGTYEKFALASLSLCDRRRNDIIGGGKRLYIREFHFSSTYRRQLGPSLRDRIYARMGEFVDNKLLARCFTKNFVLTQRDLNDNFPNNSRFGYMYNPCSFQPVEPAGERKKVVLAVGRLVAVKNFEELLEIWAQMPHRDNWKLRIVGSGGLEASLKSKAKELGIDGSVEFPGQSSHVELEMAEASIYAMTSLCEGFGVVLVEAQNAGLPCVSYDLAYGPSEIIHDGDDGYLVENRNKEQFADRLSELMNDETLRQSMGKKALTNSRSFAAPAIAKMWMDKYHNLLES